MGAGAARGREVIFTIFYFFLLVFCFSGVLQ